MTKPRSDRATWLLLATMAVTCLSAYRGLAFRISPGGAVLPFCAMAALAGAALVGRARAKAGLSVGATAFLQMTLFTILGVALSYALAARAGPLWDARLAAADAWLGFDWPRVFAAADRSPIAVWTGGLAYHSLTVQMIVCIVVLSATGRAEELRTAVAAAVLSGFATVLLSGAMPAMGNVFDPKDFHILWPSVAWMERDMIAGLRDGTWRTLNLTQLMGIVTFPSYHATLPIILAWAQRDVRWWRAVVPIWSGVTIVATPLFGGHYGIDVLAGMALAPIALMIAPRMVHAMTAPPRFVDRRGAMGGQGAPSPARALVAQAQAGRSRR